MIKHVALYPIMHNTKAPEFPASVPSPAPALHKPKPPGISSPLAGYRVTSPFGWRRHPVTGMLDFHNGIDLAATGQVVRSIMDGTVEKAGYHRNLGFFVRIKHGKLQSIYGHLSSITIETGQQLTAGTPIGVTGSTGRATGEHLHFAICHNGTYINPWKFLHGLIQHFKNKEH